jgi:guanylate kinase
MSNRALAEHGPRRGLMLVISSPSGAGKTSLSRRLVADHPELDLSVSATTRAARKGEEHGREYLFVDRAGFAEMVARDDFLEYAEVHEHRYGTPKAPVMDALAKGHDVLFDIDWQGAMAIAAAAPGDVVRVFVLPPSMVELSRRLHARAQDAEDVIQRRLGRAAGEIAMWAEYEYVLVNEDYDKTYIQLEHIYRAERLKRSRNPGLKAFVQSLLDEDRS